LKESNKGGRKNATFFVVIFLTEIKFKVYICSGQIILSELLHLRKIIQIIIPVLLVIVFCYVTNATINQHYHKLSSGLILNHAHPYQNNEDAGNPFKKHSHSSSEFILLDQISTTVFWIYLFVLFLTPLLFTFEIKTSPLVITFKKIYLYFLRNYHAPPGTSY